MKKGDDGEVPEEVQRECSLLKLVQLVFWGTGVDKQKKMEFDLVVLAVAIVYIDWVSSNAFVCICECGMLDFCELRPVAFTIFEEFHVTSSSSSVPFA